MNKILIVDDDDFQLNYLRKMLHADFEVFTAVNGTDALEKFRQCQPDLIFMDIEMPEKNGYQACFEINQEDYLVPVIFLSGLDTLDDKLNAYESGGVDFIAKPASSEQVLNKISKHLKLREKHLAEKQKLQQVANQSMSDLSLLGQIFRFMRKSYQCRDLESLSTELFELFKQFNLKTTICYKKEPKSVYYFDDRIERNLEITLIQAINNDKLIHEFGNNRALFQTSRVSILIKNMPEDELKSGSLKDYLVLIIDAVDVCVTHIEKEMSFRHIVNEFKHENERFKIELLSLFEDLDEQFKKKIDIAVSNEELSLDTEQSLQSLIENARQTADQKFSDTFNISLRLEEVLKQYENPSLNQSNDSDIELF